MSGYPRWAQTALLLLPASVGEGPGTSESPGLSQDIQLPPEGLPLEGLPPEGPSPEDLVVDLGRADGDGVLPVRRLLLHLGEEQLQGPLVDAWVLKGPLRAESRFQ